MDALYRISSSMSEPWVSWVLFVLLWVLAMNRFFIMDIALVFRGLYSRSERSYSDVSWQAKVLGLVYKVGVLSMLLYLFECAGVDCSMTKYLLSMGVVGVVLLVQSALVAFVGKVFLTDRQLDGALESRSNIYNAIGVLLWPIVVILRSFGNEKVIAILACLMLGLLVLLLLWKSVQLFLKKIYAVFYILLYISILEVLPLMVAFFVINQFL